MNTLRNALSFWLLEGKNAKEEVCVFWWFLTSVTIGALIGLGFLIWYHTMIGLIAGVIIFGPALILIYVKFNDKAIDEKIKRT